MLRRIPGHNNYLINESGAILDKDHKLVRTNVNNDGFMYVNIDGEMLFIHDLVAITYLNCDSEFK